MKLPIFIQKIYNRITKAKFFYVTLDICPDFSTGQAEMQSYTVRADDATKASHIASCLAMKEWDVDMNAIYVVESVETNDPELIYDI